MISMICIDGSNHVMGRLASQIAKMLLLGKEIYVVNAEKIVISGKPKIVLDSFKERTARGDSYHGPFYPKRPDKVFRRVVRGMLPYKLQKGKQAFKRLKVFISIPDELKGAEMTRVPKAENKLRCKYVKLEELWGKI